jgi:ribosome-interacting GTPase 1
MTPAQKLERIKSMVAKMGLKSKERTAFIKQGRLAIERGNIRHQHATKINGVLEEVQAVLKKNGVDTAHVLIKMEVSPKEKAAGINGWASTVKQSEKGSGFDLIGALTNSTQKLSFEGFTHKSF